MTSQKDWKRRIRRRMQKTGESYTAARAQLLKSRPASLAAARKPASAAGPTPAEYAKRAGMSNAAIARATGSDWKEWVAALDDAGAHAWPHRAIARHVRETFQVPAWWSQAVTVGYERIHGLRAIGQRRDGAYDANKSRTFAATAADVFAAFTLARRRACWLPGVKVVVRAATPHRTVRFAWPDGTVVAVSLVAKPGGKISAQIQHAGLADAGAASRMKAFWGERLEALGALLAT